VTTQLNAITPIRNNDQLILRQAIYKHRTVTMVSKKVSKNERQQRDVTQKAGRSRNINIFHASLNNNDYILALSDA